MFNIIDLQNQTILITGASSGIGKETSVLLNKLGARLILVDCNEDALEETISMMNGGEHIKLLCDLTNFDILQDKIQSVLDKCQNINGLVHCAGISSRKPLNVLKRNSFNKVMDVNFYSFVELVRMVTHKKYFCDGGSIVVISSISSIRGYKAKIEYCVSKAAVDACVRCMALELAARRIRVNSVMPAEVLTPLALKAKEINVAVGANDFNAPLGATEPYEVANTIAFLLSDATKTITGTSILIDGGTCI